jgi:hypothetical protein
MMGCSSGGVGFVEIAIDLPEARFWIIKGMVRRLPEV